MDIFKIRDKVNSLICEKQKERDRIAADKTEDKVERACNAYVFAHIGYDIASLKGIRDELDSLITILIGETRLKQLDVLSNACKKIEESRNE